MEVAFDFLKYSSPQKTQNLITFRFKLIYCPGEIVLINGILKFKLRILKNAVYNDFEVNEVYAKEYNYNIIIFSFFQDSF